MYIKIYLNKGEIQALSQWEGCPESIKRKLGLIEVYLLEIFNASKGTRYWEAYDCPQNSIISGEFRVSGWLGKTENVSRTALDRFFSLKEAIEYVEAEEGEIPEPLNLEGEDFEKSLIWCGYTPEEE